MKKNLQSTITLHNGVEMPQFGLGVWQVKEGSEVVNSVSYALEAGYKAIDTAAIYRNEEGVGQAIKDSGIPREELFITTKVWNADHGYESTLHAYETSLKKLGLDYVDLYLIHWPGKELYKETWRALETLYKDGKVRAIGVSNFKQHHLEDLIAHSEIVPMVNQVELHPQLSQIEIRDYCQAKGIAVEAYSPLGSGKLLEHPVIAEIAVKYQKTIAQVILRWDLQHGIITIPKSVRQERVVENATIFDFELDAEDMAKIDALNKDERVGSDPDVFF